MSIFSQDIEQIVHEKVLDNDSDFMTNWAINGGSSLTHPNSKRFELIKDTLKCFCNWIKLNPRLNPHKYIAFENIEVPEGSVYIRDFKRFGGNIKTIECTNAQLEFISRLQNINIFAKTECVLDFCFHLKNTNIYTHQLTINSFDSCDYENVNIDAYMLKINTKEDTIFNDLVDTAFIQKHRESLNYLNKIIPYLEQTEHPDYFHVKNFIIKDWKYTINLPDNYDILKVLGLNFIKQPEVIIIDYGCISIEFHEGSDVESRDVNGYSASCTIESNFNSDRYGDF